MRRTPAAFQLMAAMNPCPCGYLGDPSGRCHCTEDQVRRYCSRISGQLLDRIDLHVEAPRVAREALRPDMPPDGETSGTVAQRVAEARMRQLARGRKPNARLTTREINRHCKPDDPGQRLLERAMEQLGLSARAYHCILKVARTIADLGVARW